MQKRTALLMLLTGFLLLPCTKQSNRPSVTVYTSIYPEVIDLLQKAAVEALPGIDLRFLQLGSELVTARVNTELAAGGTKADIIMTSYPFWYHELKQAGKLLPYDSPNARQVPASLRDRDNAWVTVCIPVMVIARNKTAPGPVPKSFAELAEHRYAGRITMGDPLKSGANFSTVTALADTFGWSFFEKMRTNRLMASGGNSSTLRRVESREFPIGIVLLENLLTAQRKASDAEIIYPEDVIVPIPSPIAILRSSTHPATAKKFYDFIFCEAGQKAIIAGCMYLPLPDIPPPAGAVAWAEIAGRMYV